MVDKCKRIKKGLTYSLYKLPLKIARKAGLLLRNLLAIVISDPCKKVPQNPSILSRGKEKKLIFALIMSDFPGFIDTRILQQFC